MLGGGIATLRSGLTLRCGSTGVVACVTPYTSAYRLCAQQPKRVVEEGCSTKSNGRRRSESTHIARRCVCRYAHPVPPPGYQATCWGRLKRARCCEVTSA
jgi:hypothetical protein